MSTVPPIIPQASPESPAVQTTPKKGKSFAPTLSSAISERSQTKKDEPESKVPSDTQTKQFAPAEETGTSVQENPDTTQETNDLEQLQSAGLYSEVTPQQQQKDAYAETARAVLLQTVTGQQTKRVNENFQDKKLQQQQNLSGNNRISVKINLETTSFKQGNTNISTPAISQEPESSVLQAISTDGKHLSQNRTTNPTITIAGYNQKDSIRIQQPSRPQGNGTSFDSAPFFESNLTYKENPATAQNGTPATVSTESIMASLTDLATHDSKPVRNINAMRQEITNQYMDAKIKESSIPGQQNETNVNLDKKQGDASQQQTPFQSPYQSSPLETPTHQFAQHIHAVSTETATIATSQASTLLSPQFTEDSIVNQVVQKFRVNRIVNDSKLTLKLHPAELGDLKIDIQVKDNTVHASIVARSVTVQEIIEKHTPRLREILQEQGLTLDKLTIRVEDDSAKQFAMTDHQHMQNGQNSNERHSSPKNTSVFTLPQEKTVSESDNSHTPETIHQGMSDEKAVNVTI